MRPLRVLHQAVLKRVKHQNNLSSESVAPLSNELRETDPGRELLSTVFDESHHPKHVPSATNSGITSLEQYQTGGSRQGQDPHLLFNVGWYLERNRDVQAADVEPFSHYLDFGWKEGRSPHPIIRSKMVS